jgi:glycosyltransferase involved in cell wall biosynthesis
MSDATSPRILALIPAYNEAERIGEVIEAARQFLPVLIVDDGSTDDTASIAVKYGANVLKQVPNQGKGAALKAGFRLAISEGYQAVLTLDADGQHDPAEIPSFLAAYRLHEADLVIGKRDFRQIPPIRQLANTIGRLSFSWAVGQPVPDNQSGYRLVSNRLMAALLASRESGFEFEVEMIVTCLRSGFKLEWVPIRTIYAGESSHIQPLRHLFQFSRIVLQTRKRMKGSMYKSLRTEDN